MNGFVFATRLRRLLCLGAMVSACGISFAATVPAAAPEDAPPAPRAAVKTGSWEHAISAYTPPKYPRGFAHFDYVNPDAPQGGSLRLRNPDRRTSFDKFNPWTVKGNAPAGLVIYMFEGLAHLAQDEPQGMYGLLAEEMFVAPDLSSISFRLHPKARFWNGDPVLPADVKHSFDMLSSKEASPAYQTLVAGIERAVVVDSRTVRFDLRERKTDTLFAAGTLPVFSRKWGDGKKFDDIVGEHPITSGPYLIDRVEMPRRIEFKRNPQYWANGLGVRRGHFNFERVVYRMYQDFAVTREAFKAGEFDIMKEYGGRSWLRQHKGAKWRDGRILKTAFETETGQGLQSYQLNLRRPIFQDARVREALGYTYDFDTTGAKYPMFKRARSVFNNSDFAAVGLPSPGELKLLEPFRGELPTRVFGPAFVPPDTGADPRRLRQNLLKARELLEQAGWKLGAGGKLGNAKGDTFEIEYLAPRESGISDWQRNLEKLGITLKERVVDFALYRRRLETRDFDVITIVESDFTLPSAPELVGYYGSKAADEEGSNNFRGVKSRAADALLEALGQATTMDELRDAARAFDRVVMWNFWQVPDLYGSTENASYWATLGIPKVQPKYFTIDTWITVIAQHGPWPVWAWWSKEIEAKKP